MFCRIYACDTLSEQSYFDCSLNVSFYHVIYGLLNRYVIYFRSLFNDLTNASSRPIALIAR